jgi:meiotic recombination protein SPO11
LGIVDADPYGLDILSVYKYGSLSMQHENGKLAATRIKWLGLWASEVERYDSFNSVSGLH